MSGLSLQKWIFICKNRAKFPKNSTKFISQNAHKNSVFKNLLSKILKKITSQSLPSKILKKFAPSKFPKITFLNSHKNSHFKSSKSSIQISTQKFIFKKHFFSNPQKNQKFISTNSPLQTYPTKNTLSKPIKNTLPNPFQTTLLCILSAL